MTTARKLVFFVLATTAAFVYISNIIPQIKSEPVVVRTAIGETAAELVAAGKAIFESDRAVCLTCHSVGEDPKARCPNQDGVGERAGLRIPGLSAAEYLVESVYDPNAFVVSGFPRDQMSPVNKPPIALTDDEILATLCYLNTLGGTTDQDFVDELRAAQEPWRQGLRQVSESGERARIPIFPGDSNRGAEVFEAQGCNRCHRVTAEGPEIGPDLSSIGAAQSPQYLLESVLNPRAVIVRGYGTVVVIRNGENQISASGTPVEWIPNKERPERVRLSAQVGTEIVETEVILSDVMFGDTIMRVRVDGELQRVLGEHVEGDADTGVTLRIFENGAWVEHNFPPGVIDFVNLPASPMPQNFGDLVTPREAYDLVTFLLEQKGAR